MTISIYLCSFDAYLFTPTTEKLQIYSNFLLKPIRPVCAAVFLSCACVVFFCLTFLMLLFVLSDFTHSLFPARWFLHSQFSCFASYLNPACVTDCSAQMLVPPPSSLIQACHISFSFKHTNTLRFHCRWWGKHISVAYSCLASFFIPALPLALMRNVFPLQYNIAACYTSARLKVSALNCSHGIMAQH